MKGVLQVPQQAEIAGEGRNALQEGADMQKIRWAIVGTGDIANRLAGTPVRSGGAAGKAEGGD